MVYAKMMILSVIPVIDFIIQSGMVEGSGDGKGRYLGGTAPEVRKGSALEHLLKAPELPGLIVRLRELSKRELPPRGGSTSTARGMWETLRDLAKALSSDFIELMGMEAVLAAIASVGGPNAAAAVTPTHEACGLCGKAESASAQLLRCSACRTVRYCSKVRRRDGWWLMHV